MIEAFSEVCPRSRLDPKFPLYFFLRNFELGAANDRTDD
jgi:hypothetical protein